MNELPAPLRSLLDAMELSPEDRAHLEHSLHEDQLHLEAPRTELPSLDATLDEHVPPADISLHISPRYQDLGLIAMGGMGQVRRMLDTSMNRVVALKLLRLDRVDDPQARTRFLEEASRTARLQHPGIIPIHDQGILEDGRPWFSMQEVRGITLRRVIETLHRTHFNVFPAAALRRVLDAFLRACEAVAYAHACGVVHGDIKPDNFMLGAHGEVFVLDWGIAHEHGRALDPSRRAGTPAYMAPELVADLRAAPSAVSDVYALGAVLYELLSGRAPFSGTPAAVLAQVLDTSPAPLRTLVSPGLSGDFVSIAERAMQRLPHARFDSAGAFVDALRSTLEGAHRRARALEIVRNAAPLAERARHAREHAEQLQAQALAALVDVPSHAPAHQKALGWKLEDDARAQLHEAATLELAHQQELSAALHVDPTLPQAHAALATLYAQALQRAERAGDQAGAQRAETLLRAHDDGRFATLLRGVGALSIDTVPSGAHVTLYREIEQGRRRVRERVGDLGSTPLRAVSLPLGSYVLEVTAADFHPLLYPLHLARGEHWDCVRPGDSTAVPIPLVPQDARSLDWRYVPAGFAFVGGDAAASESLPLQRVWIDGFLIQRHPVTVRDYLEFMNALVADGHDDEALVACPRVADSIAGTYGGTLFSQSDDGRWHCSLPASHPVVSVDWRSAMRFAKWASHNNPECRLPTELEREKAARGVDGRAFPWGDHLEPTWANMVGSAPGAPFIASVHDHASDESVYGVRGLAGNVRDWCANVWTARGPRVQQHVASVEVASLDDPSLRAVRGGAWMAAPPLCRSASRYAAAPESHLAGVGFRLVTSIEAVFTTARGSATSRLDR